MNINPGDIVYGQTENDRFKINKLIGSGSFGIVYEVVNLGIGIRCALKTIITAMLNPTGLNALINEGNLASGIEHENVLRVFYFHDGNKYPSLPPYMIMEFADGGTLDKYINDRRAQQAYFSNDELHNLLISLALGMRAINEKLVHRDIKPDNILFSSGVLKISDFGLSKINGASTRTQTFKGINHVMYCAPEAWQLDKNTPAMDMYSMGIVFYELATLIYPYKVETTGDIIEAWKNAHLTQTPQAPNKINTSLGTNISQLIMKMIAKRPESRYQSWDEVIDRIRAQQAEIEIHSKVDLLVKKAMDSHNQAEQERLKQQDLIRRQKELEEIISYCFQEIIQASQSLVEEFNKRSEFAKLEFHHIPPFTIDIRLSRGNKDRVVITILPLHEEQKLDGQKIKAWGFAKGPSGRGFNLLLVETSQDDIYGTWKTFHNSHSGIVRRTDGRPEPFPFEIDELPREIQNLRAIHIYSTNIGTFTQEFLHSLIEELL